MSYRVTVSTATVATERRLLAVKVCSSNHLSARQVLYRFLILWKYLDCLLCIFPVLSLMAQDEKKDHEGWRLEVFPNM